MYPIKNQVCTLDQAEKIDKFFKDAGIKPPESYFIWGCQVHFPEHPHYKKFEIFSRSFYESFHIDARLKAFDHELGIYNAWSCAELWKMWAGSMSLPKEIFQEIVCNMGLDENKATIILADSLIKVIQKKIIKPEELTL